MILISTKDNRLLHPVGAFQIFRNFSRHLINSVFQNNRIVKIAVGVYPVLNRLSKFIKLPFTGTPALSNIRFHIDDLKRSQEAVINPFAQAVCVNWFTEIIDIGDILRFFGRCRHADLCCGRKVIQNFAPVAVLLG